MTDDDHDVSALPADCRLSSNSETFNKLNDRFLQGKRVAYKRYIKIYTGYLVIEHIVHTGCTVRFEHIGYILTSDLSVDSRQTECQQSAHASPTHEPKQR